MKKLYKTPKNRNLIFDVGMHMGEDTEFYLNKGFRLVSFEADPDLVELCRRKFKDFIDEGQLVIVSGAIVSRDVLSSGQKKVVFYKNNDVSIWGTICTDWAQRNERLGHASTKVEADVVDFSHVIKQFGVPYYLKIDIEGADMVCVNALRQFAERPDYVSIESDKTSFAKIKREIDVLSDLGYGSFRAIEQSSLPITQVPPNPSKEGAYVENPFLKGSSGLFGLELDGKWYSRRRILLQYAFIRFGYYLVGNDGILKSWKFRGAGRLRDAISLLLSFFTKAPVPGWYDTHARYSG